MLEQHLKLEDLYQSLRKSEYGLTRPVFELLLAGLIREGYVIGYKGISPVNLEKARLPLSQAVDTLTLGQLIAADKQRRVIELAHLLLDAAIDAYNMTAQEQIWNGFRQFRQKNEQAVQHIHNQVERLSREMSDRVGPMDRLNALMQAMTHLNEAIDPQQPSKSGLERLSAALGDSDDATQAVEGFKRISAFFKRDQDHFLTIKRYLNNPALTIPDTQPLADLRQIRQDLDASRFDLSDDLILYGGIEKLKENFAFFQDRYLQAYEAEHQKRNASIDIGRIEALRRSRAFGVLGRLAQLTDIPVKQGYTVIDRALDKAVENLCVTFDRNSLRLHPRCRCNFALGDPPATIAATELEARLEASVREYVQMIQTDRHIWTRLNNYLETMLDVRKEVPEQPLKDLLNLQADLPLDLLLEQLEQILQPDVIYHVNQALKGKIKKVRRQLSGLLKKLEGRHHTRQELLRVFEEWLDSGEGLLDSGTYIEIESPADRQPNL